MAITANIAPTWLSIATVAQRLGMSAKHALRLVRSGKVPGGRMLYSFEGRKGERWLVERDAFEEWHSGVGGKQAGSEGTRPRICNHAMPPQGHRNGPQPCYGRDSAEIRIRVGPAPALPGGPFPATGRASGKGRDDG